MSKRLAVVLVLIVVAVAFLVAAGIAWYSVGLHADATGTGGYIPAISWITGVGGIVALVAAIWVLQARPRAEESTLR